MQEVWQPVKGYEDLYAVSDQGRVKRIAKRTWHPARRGKSEGFWWTCRERILKTWVNGDYLKVWLCKDGKQKLKKVHRLVAEAFVPGDHSLTVNHIDGDKLNNTPSNLEWISHSDNVRHQHANGLTNLFGQNGPAASARRVKF